jgi:hypothetical protein
MSLRPGRFPRKLALILLQLLLCSGTVRSNEEPLLLHHQGSTLTVHLSQDFSPEMQDNLEQWTSYISKSLLQVYGRWPRKHWEISVSPTSANHTDPIPWAQVNRGDPDLIEFFISSATTTKDLVGAWTSYHELAHLLIPYRGWGDIWFSEGLASYYQNVLQARMGLVSEREMWQDLCDGFMRGSAQSEFKQFNLHEISDDMREKNAYMRVYWSGAWYFLKADFELRQRSGGKVTLDTALERLNHCCAEQKLSVAQIVKKLDEVNELALFVPLYRELRASTSTPDFEPLFASMGIKVDKNKVQLSPASPGAELRSQIAAAKKL